MDNSPVMIKTVYCKPNHRNSASNLITRLQDVVNSYPNSYVYPDELNNCLYIVDIETKKVVSQILLD